MSDTYSKVYNADDIFEDIEGDPENVLMRIPDEFIQRLGWQEGDAIGITIIDGAIHLKNLSRQSAE
jgi:hypothetical protein